MTAQPASPDRPAMEVEHVERTCSCGTPFQAEVRYAILPFGPLGQTRRLAIGPGPRVCPQCREQQLIVERAEAEAQHAAEVERIEREAAERLAAAIPAKYRHADFAALPDGLRDALGDFWAKPRGIYLSGPPGTGKTYAAAALVRSAWGHTIHRGAWANVPILLDQLRRSMRKAELTADQIEQLCTAPLAVLDDVGAEKPSEWVVDRLYVVINARYEAELPTIVTSNLKLSDLGDRIGMRIVSRLVETTTQFELAGQDRRLLA